MTRESRLTNKRSLDIRFVSTHVRGIDHVDQVTSDTPFAQPRRITVKGLSGNVEVEVFDQTQHRGRLVLDGGYGRVRRILGPSYTLRTDDGWVQIGDGIEAMHDDK